MPEKLGKSPLLEALFEIRFEPSTAGAGDLLPGLLYPSLRSDYPNVEPLPISNVPKAIRDQNPALLYQASHRLRGGANSIQVGDHAIALSTLAYPGWTTFKQLSEKLMRSLKVTDVVKEVERFSFRYINVIECVDPARQLSVLNGRFEIIGAPIEDEGAQIRFERSDSGFRTIVQLIPSTTAKLSSGKQVSGLLVDVDTFREQPGKAFLDGSTPLLDNAHSVLKRTFFSLLTETTLQRMEPRQ